MKLVVAGLFLVALALSQSSTPPAAAPAPELRPVATDAADATDATSIVDDQDEGAVICPLKWFCDDTGLYYSTKTACTAACSSVCYRDYACTGGCVCP